MPINTTEPGIFDIDFEKDAQLLKRTTITNSPIKLLTSSGEAERRTEYKIIGPGSVCSNSSNPLSNYKKMVNEKMLRTDHKVKKMDEHNTRSMVENASEDFSNIEEFIISINPAFMPKVGGGMES